MKVQWNKKRRLREAAVVGALLLSFFMAWMPVEAHAQESGAQDAQAVYDDCFGGEAGGDGAVFDYIAEDDADGDMDADTDAYDYDVLEETVGGQPFSVDGNGELIDDIEDEGSKEFFTVQTKDNRTFFLIIDRASASDNVYMLSLIDESDLEGFLDKGQETSVFSLAAPAVTSEETEEAKESAEEAPDSGWWWKFLLFVIFAGVTVGSGYYYIRVYSPKKKEAAAGSEHLEEDFFGEGVDDASQEIKGYADTLDGTDSDSEMPEEIEDGEENAVLTENEEMEENMVLIGNEEMAESVVFPVDEEMAVVGSLDEDADMAESEENSDE